MGAQNWLRDVTLAEGQGAEVVSAGGGGADGMRGVDFQHRRAGKVHSHDHGGGAALSGDAFDDGGGAAMPEAQAADLRGADRSQQPGLSQSGNRLAGECAAPVYFRGMKGDNRIADFFQGF